MFLDKPFLLYNLFPRLVGNFDEWKKHLARIKKMGFDWIYINPFHYPGFSGSLYAVKDYFRINPIFINEKSPLKPFEQLKDFIDTAHKYDLKLVMDLIINHTAKDHPFTSIHPEWYKKDNEGKIKSPGAWDNGKWIEWGDLAEIDNLSNYEREKLWNYWYEVVEFYINLGFDGFRCDAAYAIPTELWKFLIEKTKTKKSDIIFLAESLGCPLESTISLAKNGFDYIFNSSKWWNYKDNWLIDQYNETRIFAPSISFPESHDTERLFKEADNEYVFKQRVIFTAFFSKGWMIPLGLEFGFKKRVNVVSSTPFDYEDTKFDYSDFIKKIISLKTKNKILYEEGKISDFKVINDISLFLKYNSTETKKALYVINTASNKKKINLKKLSIDFSKAIELISNNIIKEEILTLDQNEIKIIQLKN
ncbi:MAG: alpha-amylase family glycosyl hydrolase [Brevinematales bacterium]|nr:alpha-amylase family glycosyl hydrolase [Brevinematales bacterium]